MPREVFSQFANAMTAGGQFYQQMINTRSEAEKFGEALSKRKLGVGPALSAIRDMRNEMGVINQLAEKQVKMQQSIAVGMGRNRSGVGQAAVFTPASLDLKDFATRTQ